jgi:DNA segregation ATPase FtsK/SpoIIIE-like protein
LNLTVAGGRSVLKIRYQKILGVVLLCIATMILVSLISFDAEDYHSLVSTGHVNNVIGPIGAWIAYIVRSLFGITSYIVVPVLIISGIFLFKNEWVRNPSEKSIFLLFLAISSSAVVSFFVRDIPQLSGGHAGLHILNISNILFGKTVSVIVISGINLFAAVLLLIMVFSPEGKWHEAFTGFPRRMRNFLNFFSSVKNRRNIFEDGGDTPGRKFPWITKKKIIVYETEKPWLSFDSVHANDLPGSPVTKDRMLLTDDSAVETSIENNALASADMIEEDADVVLNRGEYSIQNKEESDNNQHTVYSFKDIPDDDSYHYRNPSTEAQSPGIDEFDKVEESAEDHELSARSALFDDAMNAENLTGPVFENIPINEEYSIPTSFLISTKPPDSESWKNEIRRNSILLKKMLAEFGIESDVVNVNRGPVITLYEMQIAPGIKVTRIVSLADDIAMALAAHRVRIVAPIPGKSAIGVEIPNRYRETVTLGDIVKSEEFQTFEGSLVVALGKDILGNPVMLDLKRLPHLLIAGATGSGKSVCVNSIITSLLYNYDPNYLRFIMIDPKMVELQLYNGLPHLLTPVIVDPFVTPMVLKWTMHEMERRYCLLSEMNTRDIERYNEKIELYGNRLEKLPYIVTIIDEMADLIMTSKEIEGYITRIAQKARAVGIHLVVATQRPSVDIITGIIKANFPARIAFQTAQKTDSRTIIDQNGAEKLLGRGDMLYQSPTSSFPIRIQGGFITEEEIERVVAHLCRLGKASYIDIEQTLYEAEESKDLDEASDELFQEALKIVEETRKASASYLQRRLSIGYNRAARIIEKMEEKGYIGPQIGSKPREVLI